MQTTEYEVLVLGTRAVGHYTCTTDREPAGVEAVPYELRAEVTFTGPHDEPSVVWLDAVVLADLDLSDADRGGAEEMAIELAAAKLMADTEAEAKATERRNWRPSTMTELMSFEEYEP